jgi:hypothetical protein
MNVRPDPGYNTRSEATKCKQGLELATEIHKKTEPPKPLPK